MKVNKANLAYFLSNADTLEVSVYSGGYTWGVSQCEELWRNISDIAEDGDIVSYFLGIILHIEKKQDEKKRSFLLDGQQRLITFSLIFAALRETITEEEDDDDLSYKKLHKFLFTKIINSYKPKLLVNPYDKTTYDTLITGGGFEENALSPNLIENYQFFKNKIETSKWSLKKLFNTLLKVEFINISLDEFDNPKAIYDSLQSSGKMLSQIDQIKNEIMIGLTRLEQMEAYTNFWCILEKSFEKNASIEVLESFIISYLTIQNQGQVINPSNIYQEFSRFYQKMLKIQDRKDILENLLKYSNYYLKLYSLKINSRKVKRNVKAINESAGDKAYPFLMELMDDLENGLINEDLLAEILKTTISLINESDEKDFCFSSLSGNINKMLALKDFIPKIVIDKQLEPLVKPKGPETINDIIKATGS